MRKQILTHLRLDQNAHAVADHGDKVVAQTFEDIRREQDGHDDEKGLVHALRQVGLHTVFRHIREHEVDGRDQHRTAHINEKELFFVLYVRYEYFKR